MSERENKVPREQRVRLVPVEMLFINFTLFLTNILGVGKIFIPYKAANGHSGDTEGVDFPTFLRRMSVM